MRHKVLREMLTQHFFKNSEHSEELKWAALFLVTMKLQVIRHHHGPILPPNTSPLFIGDIFPLLKCICKAAPTGSSFPSSGLSLSSIQGLHHTGPAPKSSRRTVQLIFGSKFLDITSLFLQRSLVSRNKPPDQGEFWHTLISEQLSTKINFILVQVQASCK